MVFKKNVEDIISNLSKKVGKWDEESFYTDIINECKDYGINSPIEQILHGAIQYIMKINFINIADPFEVNGQWYAPGICIKPQEKIGQYRVDFLISFNSYNRRTGLPKLDKTVIVECDSQQFHERDEEERRYEKKRDRFLVSKGYKVFHFTGSEIVKNSTKVAVEILSYLTEEECLDDGRNG